MQVKTGLLEKTEGGQEWVCVTNSPSYFRYLNKQDHERLLFWASQLLLILEGFIPQLNYVALAAVGVVFCGFYALQSVSGAVAVADVGHGVGS